MASGCILSFTHLNSVVSVVALVLFWYGFFLGVASLLVYSSVVSSERGGRYPVSAMDWAALQRASLALSSGALCSSV